MAEPKQKSLEFPSTLRRFLPNWITPMWTDAARWRAVVRNQPIAIICRDRLIAYLQGLPWDIRAKETGEQEALEEDIKYYKEFVLRDFDEKMELIWQDALDLPIGGGAELVRWPANVLPEVEEYGEIFKVTRPNPRGHVFKVVPVDGATLAPTYDNDFPIMQRVPGNATQGVFFNDNEMGRILLSPRPEFKVKGYGMPPPQRIFLSISLLYNGDQYYANLLSDTPEAGILDLIDMSMDDAQEWVSSYQTLLQGIDPQKIGVLYQHEKPAVWIPFGRPPADMLYNETTLKYGRITAAGYWLSLADVGLDPEGRTLAGEIRRQRDARRTGFGIVTEKTTNFMNRNVLPPYLEFAFIEKDDEAMSNTGRARLLNAQALKAMKEGGFITADEGQEQLLKDGLLTIEVMPPSERPQPPQLPAPPQGEQGPGQTEDQTSTETERVPPSQGGRGDVGVNQALVGRGPDVGDVPDSAVPEGSPYFAALAGVFDEAFSEMQRRMGDAQLKRLVKAALREQFPTTSKALIGLAEHDLLLWQAERVKAWFGEESVFDQIPQVQKIDQETLDKLEDLLNRDRWWALPDGIDVSIFEIIKDSFAQGAVVAAELIQQFLYEEGLADTPKIGIDFKLKNPETLAELESRAAQMVRRVNDGTKYYLKRIIAAGVDEGVSSQEIAERIREGQGVDEILRDSGLVDEVIERARAEIGGLSESRTASIVNTEINRAESEGRVKQWKETGLTRKRWEHTGSDVPCRVCQGNIAMGFVDMDFLFNSVFGEGSIQSPPGHPGVCHCHVAFDEAELIDKAGELNVWDGS